MPKIKFDRKDKNTGCLLNSVADSTAKFFISIISFTFSALSMFSTTKKTIESAPIVQYSTGFVSLSHVTLHRYPTDQR